jgi:hypothetical protein
MPFTIAFERVTTMPATGVPPEFSTVTTLLVAFDGADVADGVALEFPFEHDERAIAASSTAPWVFIACGFLRSGGEPSREDLDRVRFSWAAAA